jgi:hypothetical protein
VKDRYILLFISLMNDPWFYFLCSKCIFFVMIIFWSQ